MTAAGPETPTILRKILARKAEEIAERRNSDLLDDTFNFNLDEDF